MGKNQYIHEIANIIGVTLGYGRRTLVYALMSHSKPNLIEITKIMRERASEIKNYSDDKKISIAAAMTETLRRPNSSPADIEIECFETEASSKYSSSSSTYPSERQYNGGSNALESNDGPADEYY